MTHAASTVISRTLMRPGTASKIKKERGRRGAEVLSLPRQVDRQTCEEEIIIADMLA